MTGELDDLKIEDAFRIFAAHVYNGQYALYRLLGRRLRTLPPSLSRPHFRRFNGSVFRTHRAFGSLFTDGPMASYVMDDSGARISLKEVLSQDQPDDCTAPEIPDDRLLDLAEIEWRWSAYALIFVKASIFRSWLASPDVNDFSFTSIRRNLLECNRVNLIGLAQDGIVSGDELETLARTWGIRPFAQKPSEEEYQPQRYPYWTLPMVITWIAFRDMDAVREQINDYRKASWDWQRAERRIPIDGGKFWHTVIADELVSDRPASVADLSLKEALAEAQDDHGKIVSIKSAREALWTNLALGKLTASALDAFGSITTVPAHEWPYLDLAYELAGPDYVVGSLNPTKSVYSDVKLAQVEVTKVWTAAADAKKPASIDLRKWLVGQMRDSPEVRLKPKSDYLEIAQKTYGVSKAAFDREWVFALEQVPNAKPFWTKAGRPKKVRK